MGDKKSKWKQIIRYEWNRQICSRKYQYIVPVIIALQVCIQRYRNFQQPFSPDDFFCGFLEGMLHLEAGSTGSFLIPGDWCLFFVFLLYITGKSSKDFTEGIGMQILLRSEDALYVWRSKCLVCIGNIWIYFGSAYLSIILFCTWEAGSLKAVFGDSNILSREQILIQLVLPVMAASAIGIWQMVFSMLSNSILSIIIMCILLIVSAYFESWFLIGNYLMKLRVAELLENGISYFQMLLFLCALIMSGFFIGKKVMRRLDYIHVKGDL